MLRHRSGAITRTDLSKAFPLLDGRGCIVPVTAPATHPALSICLLRGAAAAGPATSDSASLPLPFRSHLRQAAGLRLLCLASCSVLATLRLPGDAAVAASQPSREEYALRATRASQPFRPLLLESAALSTRTSRLLSALLRHGRGFGLTPAAQRGRPSSSRLLPSCDGGRLLGHAWHACGLQGHGRSLELKRLLSSH